MKSISYYFKRTTEPKHVDSEMEQEDKMEQEGEMPINFTVLKKNTLFGNFSLCY